jgi:hypothetical protein
VLLKTQYQHDTHGLRIVSGLVGSFNEGTIPVMLIKDKFVCLFHELQYWSTRLNIFDTHSMEPETVTFLNISTECYSQFNAALTAFVIHESIYTTCYWANYSANTACKFYLI